MLQETLVPQKSKIIHVQVKEELKRVRERKSQTGNRSSPLSLLWLDPRETLVIKDKGSKGSR
jgi:hypothetical protein